MWTFILVVIALAVIILLAVAATKPNTFSLSRTTMIKAPPDVIFPLINDLHGFNIWNPFAKKEPAIQQSYSGPENGVGARYAWEGKKVGVGSMEIAESTPPSRVSMKLDFVKPFEAHNIADFTLEPKAEGTQVTWRTHGPANFMTKLIHTVISMDRMVGKDFEAGLADLKAEAETRARA